MDIPTTSEEGVMTSFNHYCNTINGEEEVTKEVDFLTLEESGGRNPFPIWQWGEVKMIKGWGC
jgi:hypothetical protein